MALPSYASPLQRVWYYAFRVICAQVFFYLMFPILVIVPLSFNAENFFTFTPEMLALDPAGFSLKHYVDFFTNPDWQLATRNSLTIAPMATLISVSLGTLAAPVFDTPSDDVLAPDGELIDIGVIDHWQNEADGLKNDQDALNEFYRQFPSIKFPKGIINLQNVDKCIKVAKFF